MKSVNVIKWTKQMLSRPLRICEASKYNIGRDSTDVVEAPQFL